jgi:hypothetical protein
VDICEDSLAAGRSIVENADLASRQQFGILKGIRKMIKIDEDPWMPSTSLGDSKIASLNDKFASACRFECHPIEAAVEEWLAVCYFHFLNTVEF